MWTFVPRISNKGRKALLTPEVLNAVIISLRAGNYIETAAAYAGISKNTLFDWLKRGRREKRRLAKDKRLRPRSSESQFVIFVDGVGRALAQQAGAGQVHPAHARLRREVHELRTIKISLVAGSGQRQ